MRSQRGVPSPGRRNADYRKALTLAIAAATAVLAAPWPGSAAAQPDAGPAQRVTLAFLPNGTSPRALGRVEGISPGALSAGLGEVPPVQTYLDITQGNRIFGSLYGSGVPNLFTIGGEVPPALWEIVTERAADAPADIVPGLLASTLSQSGRPGARADPLAGTAGLAAVDREGRVASTEDCPAPGCPGLTVVSTPVDRLARLIERLRGDDLLIAIERPPPESERLLSAGIAGRGFDGQLTSDSTRRPGLVLSTDVAPTVLDRYGIEVPDAMTGSPIRTEGEADPGEVASLERRLAEVGPRRGPVIGTSVLVWVAFTLLAAAALGTRGARPALALLGVSAIYLPALLLLAGALEPSEWVEAVIVGLGAPALAAATIAVVPGYGAVAIAASVTVLAYAIDVVAGSPLTALSLIGPNPALGVRFFGIGNELEATLAPLVLIGTGSALVALMPRPAPAPGELDDRSRRLAAASFGVAALLAVAVFAPGRFGADVGVAIVLPVGAAVAAAYVLGGTRRRFILLVIAIPILALGALAAVDLVLGGDAHLSRSVLEAGGLDELGEVAERRLRLSASSFSNRLGSPFLFVTVALLVAGVVYRRRIASWFEGRRPALAGFLGAAAAVGVGTLANDSGVLLLMIGTAYLGLYAGYAWATRA
jgi:hypothetical protein